MRRLILAAALAAASLSFAPAFADVSAPATGSAPDAAGVDDLGVDISGVNLSPSGVHAFLASQPSEVRRQIENACSTFTMHPGGAGEQTLAFCADIGKA